MLPSIPAHAHADDDDDASSSLVASDFSPWFSCVAAVSFHVTKGHQVDSVHPKRLTLPAHLLSCIARLSLPDMTIDREGDLKFTFRFRYSPQTTTTNTTTTNKDEEVFYYGAVFFRQQRDPKEQRGYMQRSVVVLTRHHEHVSLAQEFAQVVGPVFFSYACSEEVLERACSDVMDWNSSTNSSKYVVAGTALDQATASTSTSMFTDTALFSTFGSLAVSLWPLWELALTGQSILVLGPTPDRCSKAVLGICSLIAPVPVAYDFRPFLTVLDHDFARLSSQQQQHPCIVGGSNPFLLKCFEHFPNVVSLGSLPQVQPILHTGGLAASSPSSSSAASPSDFVLFRRSHTLRSLLKSNKWETPLLITKDKQLLVQQREEDAILRKLKLGTSAQNNDGLRAHFYQLTKAFLQPIESFLRTRQAGMVRAYEDSARGPSSSSSGGAFCIDDFLAFLSAAAGSNNNCLASAVSSSSKRCFPQQLYARFIQGPNFAAWLEMERGRLAQEQFTVMRTLICETSPSELLLVRGIEKRVAHYIALEQAKDVTRRDGELVVKMHEHLVVLQQHRHEEEDTDEDDEGVCM